MDPKEKKTKQEEELKVDDIQDTVEGQSQNEEATEATEPLTAEEKVASGSICISLTKSSTSSEMIVNL